MSTKKKAAKRGRPRLGRGITEPVCVNVSSELRERIRSIAEAEDRPQSRVWREVISAGLEAIYGPDGTERIG